MKSKRPLITRSLTFLRWTAACLVAGCLLGPLAASNAQQAASPEDAASRLTGEQMELILAAQKQRVEVVEQVMGSVVAVYGENRQGGGSGVIVDPSGIALTNHHVIMGAGVSGWGGLADGKLYHWKLVGTDPGGDVAVIQLEGEAEFPFTPLGDSDEVRVGDWVLAMGNPFVLTEDQKPTVTLGIVSGVKRYQPGAGKNQLIYGNCIQVDSSINPGNSGGPLFNMRGRVIGINGRGSFQDRGRVNVGLGYAISANQIRNFLPELLATKLVEHGTLDANFTDRNGKVVCENLYENTPLYLAGMRPGDELLEFEGVPINSANQFTNLICTLPEDWPARLKFRNSAGEVQTFHTRLFGLPYAKPKRRASTQRGEKPSPEEQQQQQQQQAMFELLAASPGTIRNLQVNRDQTARFIDHWRGGARTFTDRFAVLHLIDEIRDAEGNVLGEYEFWCPSTFDQFRVKQTLQESERLVVYDGQKFHQCTNEEWEPIPDSEARDDPLVVSALGILAANSKKGSIPFFDETDIQLDGSDLAQWQNACRFRTGNKTSGQFYFWLSQLEHGSQQSVELLKASATLDADGETGGMTFGHWREKAGVRFPGQRTWVRNLAESKVLDFENRGTELQKQAPAGLFELQGERDRP